MSAITTRDLFFVCGTVIPAGSRVEIVERFIINRGRRRWQCLEGDVQ